MAAPIGLNKMTLSALYAESMRAAAKHGNDKTLINPDLSRELKLAALIEEIGEVAQLLTYDKRPHEFVLTNEHEWNGACDHSDDPSALARCLDESNMRLMDDWADRFVKELLQVANLAAAWSEAEDHIRGRH